MKKTTLIFIVFLLAGCATTNLPPATPASEEMEQANVIHIYTDLEKEEAYKTIAQVLTDEGFTISSSDPMLMNITTDWRNADRSNSDLFFGGGYEMKVNASVRSNERNYIKLTSQFSPAVSDARSINTGRGGYPQRSWDTLKALAQKFPNGDIMYARD